MTLLSRFDVDEDIRDGSLTFVPLLGKELSDHELVLGHRRGAVLNPAAALLEETLRAEIDRIQSKNLG